MLSTTVKVGREEFRLSLDQDVTEMKEAAVAAVRSGGQFIDLVVAGGAVVAVLMVPGQFVSVEQRPIVIDDRPEEPWADDIDCWDVGTG
jgi:hypothetical protein